MAGKKRKKRRKWEDLLIHHPYLPYTIRAIKVGDVAIIALNRRSIYRVIHIKSALTLTDVEGLEPALRFAQYLQGEIRESEDVANAFKNLTWHRFMAYKKSRKADKKMQLVEAIVHKFSRGIFHLSADSTAKYKYRYRPVFVKK